MVNDVELVCGNSDYRVIFEFDEDWAKYNAKTALFVFGDTTVEVPFTGNIITEKDAVAIEKATKCYIGVFTGDLITTTKAEIKCLTSIRDIAGKPTPPNEDVYNKIIGLINDLKLEGSAIIEVETLPENPEDIEDGWLYQTVEGLFWYDGEWHKIIDETELSQIDNRIAQVESIAKGAGQAVSYGNYATMIDALNVMPRGRYRVGQSVMIVTVDVPDLWISAIGEESTEYTYTSDEDFVSAIKSNGSVKVGHYQLSQLETQKVDLTEYVKNTDYAADGKAGVIKVGKYAIGLVDGYLYVYGVANNKISERGEYGYLRANNTDTIVKVGLTDSQITWTDDKKEIQDGKEVTIKGDKTKARELIGAVGFTDYAGEGKAGLIKTSNLQGGCMVLADGTLYFFGIQDGEWTSRDTAYASSRHLRLSHVDNIVKYGLTDNKTPLTDTEKASAQKWLGVPTDLDEFTDKILTDESLAVKYTAEDYPFSYMDDSFGLASTDILSIDELDYYAATVYFDHWGNGETETVTYSLSEFDMSAENYGYMFTKSDAKIYIVTDPYAFADAYQIPVTSKGLYFSKYRGSTINVDIISVDRLPIKKIDSQYLDIPKASRTQYGLVKTYGELTSVSGYEGCKTHNGILYTKSYTNEKSGQISGTCSTAEATTDKTVSNYSYELTMYGIVAIKFNNAVPANSTLNINYRGATPMYYRGKAITSNVIKAGDIATFMYNGSQYVLLSVDRWHEDIVSLMARIEALENK